MKVKSRFNESRMQESCVTWYRLNYPTKRRCLFAVPNGAHLGGTTPEARAKKWRRLEKEGAMAGVADLFLMANPGIFIEMKSEEGRQSVEQKDFQRVCSDTGYAYVVIRSYEDFQKLIINSMGPAKFDQVANLKYAQKG